MMLNCRRGLATLVSRRAFGTAASEVAPVAPAASVAAPSAPTYAFGVLHRSKTPANRVLGLNKVFETPEGGRRQALIYYPAPSPIASVDLSRTWTVKFQSPTQKQASALMGWTATLDQFPTWPTAGFQTLDEAVAYCEVHGVDYTIKRPNAPKIIRPKAYADKFKWKGPEWGEENRDDDNVVSRFVILLDSQ